MALAGICVALLLAALLAALHSIVAGVDLPAAGSWLLEQLELHVLSNIRSGASLRMGAVAVLHGPPLLGSTSHSIA